MSLSTRLAGMFAGAAVVIFALIGTMLCCILDRQTERLQQGEVDVRFSTWSRGCSTIPTWPSAGRTCRASWTT
ncbi:hypothetical protein P4234_29975 [Pseudomonas aeruginosa]|nr:hypothetical protein [Pseudomonas aeruginosa]